MTGRALAVSWCRLSSGTTTPLVTANKGLSLRARAVTNTNRLEVCLAYIGARPNTGIVLVKVEILTPVIKRQEQHGGQGVRRISMVLVKQFSESCLEPLKGISCLLLYLYGIRVVSMPMPAFI